MNRLNRSLVGVRAKTQARPGVGGVNAGASKVGMTLGLADGGVRLLKSASEELELIKQVDLLDFFLVHFQVMI